MRQSPRDRAGAAPLAAAAEAAAPAAPEVPAGREATAGVVVAVRRAATLPEWRAMATLATRDPHRIQASLPIGRMFPIPGRLRRTMVDLTALRMLRPPRDNVSYRKSTRRRAARVFMRTVAPKSRCVLKIRIAASTSHAYSGAIKCMAAGLRRTPAASKVAAGPILPGTTRSTVLPALIPASIPHAVRAAKCPASRNEGASMTSDDRTH
jgi:hypothetical protein